MLFLRQYQISDYGFPNTIIGNIYIRLCIAMLYSWTTIIHLFAFLFIEKAKTNYKSKGIFAYSQKRRKE